MEAQVEGTGAKQAQEGGRLKEDYKG